MEELKVIPKSRVGWIDFAKGIGIILVIIGHSAIPKLTGIIFSFHMPLFFIASGFTTNWKSYGGGLRVLLKSFKSLILPAYILYFIDQMIRYLLGFKTWNIKTQLRISLFIYFENRERAFGEGMRMGMVWFLITLALGKLLFGYLHNRLNFRVLLLVSSIISCCGVLIGQKIWLPFAFDIVMSIQVFICVGYILKRGAFFQIKNNKSVLFFGIGWIILIGIVAFFSDGHKYLEISPRFYPLFPICYVCAIAGSIFTMMVSQILADLRPHIRVIEGIELLGKYSIYLFGVHYLDWVWSGLYSFPGTTNVVDDILSAILRLLIDLIIFVMVCFIMRIVKQGKKINVL